MMFNVWDVDGPPHWQGPSCLMFGMLMVLLIVMAVPLLLDVRDVDGPPYRQSALLLLDVRNVDGTSHRQG